MQAPVEIRYEGAVLARAVAPAGSLDDGGTLFLPLPDPMPVGTRLELRSGHETAFVRVVKVSESADASLAGISVRPVGHSEPIELPPEPEPVPAPAAAPAGPAPVAPTSAEASASGPVGTSNGAGRASAAGVIGESDDDGPADGDDTSSTSEYPAISNGQGGKRRQRKRKR